MPSQLHTMKRKLPYVLVQRSAIPLCVQGSMFEPDKFHKVMAVASMAAKTGYWQKKVKNRIQAGEMRLLTSTLGVTRQGRLTSEATGKTLKLNSLNDAISKHRDSWFSHIMYMDHSRFPWYMLLHKPTGKRSLGRPRKRWVSQMWGASTNESQMLQVEEEKEDWNLSPEAVFDVWDFSWFFSVRWGNWQKFLKQATTVSSTHVLSSSAVTSHPTTRHSTRVRILSWKRVGEILGSRGGGYENVWLLECYTV
jgi:hypothetical protein